ncbi:MAG: CarD family transcriptional regulator, partial [Candidatus Didemnitutus sp.]|nr:CarD family transcriptional regulator [Candidatus Didemnitutus sp.]
MSAPFPIPRTKITGVCPPARAFSLGHLVGAHPAPVWLVITEEARELDVLAEDLALFHHARASSAPLEILIFPEAQADNRDLRETFHAAGDRLTVLSKLRHRRHAAAAPTPLVILATPGALLQSVPPPEDFSEREFELRRGEVRPFQALIDLLTQFDYDGEAVCEAPGQYAVRGGIVDIYPITAHQPYRLDFFGDTLEDIRTLDPVTQRSGEAVERITLTAAPTVHAAGAQASLLAYLGPGTHAAVIEPKAIEEAFDLLGSAAAVPEGAASATGGSPFWSALGESCAQLFGLADLDLASEVFDHAPTEETWDTESLVHHRSAPEMELLAHERLQAEDAARREFLLQVLQWKQAGYAVDFFISKEGDEQRTRELLDEDKDLKALQPRFVRGSVNEGFRLTARAGGAGQNYLAVTETEIFGRKRQRRIVGKRALVTPSAVDQLLDFSELVEGDFVVHLGHGVAVFRGLTKIESADGVREVISLEFDDKVTLHVPLQESHLISRYVGLSKIKPQLGRVGSGKWEKVRAAAERATLDLAAELLQIQARREAQPGHAFAGDTMWQKEFEGAFPYTETPDQLKAINDTRGDMEKTRPMDRLVCGDVGFGKTEVAIRAAFKSVMGGKQ